MTLGEVFTDKTIKAKEKVATISKWLLDGSLPADELLAFAEGSKDSEKATCIEALEAATKQAAQIGDEVVFPFVTKALTQDAPRIKWESARVVGNIAHLHLPKLGKTIKNLLNNAEHEGTVVRWATAFALGEIIKLKTDHNKKLLPAIEALINKEEDNGVKKKYLDAIKKAKK